MTFENAIFKPEQKGVESGTVVDRKGKPVQAHLLLFDEKGNKVLVFNSDKNGKFYFKSILGNMTLIAYTDAGKTVRIIKDQPTKGYYAKNRNDKNKENDEKTKTFAKNEKLLKETIKQKAVANIALNEDSAALDEVVIIGYGSVKKQSLTGAISTIRTDDIVAGGNTLSQALQGRIAGISVSEGFSPGSTTRILIRGSRSISGNGAPLFIVDGVPYAQGENPNMLPSEIESVTVLKDIAATTLYGSSATNGVILITSKNGNFRNNWGKKKLNNTKYNNYAVQSFYNYNPPYTYKAKAFYIPKYDNKIAPEERTDFRQTIYWNPVVQTDENGKAEFEFYNSDAITSFKITAEGIGFNGLIGKQEKEYATNKTLNIDFKVPNYMALNDTIVLPVTIINESEKSIQANIDLVLPEHIKLLETFDYKVTIAPKMSLIKNIKIVPLKKAVEITIQVSVKSQDFSDTVKRQATILSPYFPTETSISGSKSQAFKFDINHAVKNSIEAEFNIYTDVVGDVMNGIEGLIRKPYGCFEQTSSSTYPNIMVLKYLKESGKSNPEIEEKAMTFIKQGYERLISFETKAGGFEWFGHTPPHETLTAYGILEFTEMKEVYSDVDQKMIDRTVKWLLSRKDGKGGFKKSKKGYDSFASSPIDVANAYIIYALSEAYINADINLEFNTAYNDAIKSNDTYKMALLALTSYNLNKQDKATILIDKIKTNIDEYSFEKLPVTNTIARSYGAAKNIETTAFTLLALMEEKTNNDILIAKGIEHLVGKRQHGRFGSTQSTAMALKALIAYTKNQKQKIINKSDAIELVINGKTLKRQLSVNAGGKITIDNLSGYLNKGPQNIAVTFSNEKAAFPYSLNVTWDSYVPDTSNECPLLLETEIAEAPYKVGDNVSMSINVSNKKDEKLGMVTAIIGIPSGITPQPWQLKELLEQNKAAYYEIFDNYLVFYWKEFDVTETKAIRLDLKADIAGSYKAPASTAYLYYGDEYKTWISGNTLNIKN